MEPGLGAGFYQPELCVGQAQLLVDLFGGVFLEVEPDQDLSIALPKAVEDSAHDRPLLIADTHRFRIKGMITDPEFDIFDRVLLPCRDVRIDLRGNFPPRNCAHVAEETFRRAKNSTVNLLDEFDDCLVEKVLA